MKLDLSGKVILLRGTVRFCRVDYLPRADQVIPDWLDKACLPGRR